MAGNKRGQKRKANTKRKKGKAKAAKKLSLAEKLRRKQAQRKRPRLGRPSPAQSATLFPIGTRKIGQDGYIWVVIRAGTTRRWKEARASPIRY